MPRGKIDDAALETEIGRLPALSLLELRNRWKTLFGHSAPKSLRRNFLARAVAYQIQVEAYGGLSVAIKRRLREIADAIRNGDTTTRAWCRTNEAWCPGSAETSPRFNRRKWHGKGQSHNLQEHRI